MAAEGRRVVAVLRSGGEFQPRHAQALQRQAARWAPEARFECLSDVEVPGVPRIPSRYNWPGWWSKMELFRPDIEGDLLCTDLDNVFLGPLSDILSVTAYTTQRGQSNALAFYPAATRAKIWAEWIRDPAGHMHRFARENAEVKHRFGDGGFIASVVTAEQCWEELFPGQVFNIALLAPQLKMASAPWRRSLWPLRVADIPQETRVFLCYQPWRPWTLPVFKLMGLYE
jgi:hypothetical protein